MEGNLLSNLTGMRDLLPEEISRWHLVEDTARRIFARYAFQEIRTPIMEATELFARGIGADTDIVGKEMYTFEDQSGKSITLRPEATAPVVRSYLQHNMRRNAGLARLYYIGPMFRHEKKQKGRWRQFYQIGAEVLGSDHPAIESEVIEMILHLLGEMKVAAHLQINSVGDANCRPSYVQLLRDELRKVSPHLCEDCRRRTETNPLRVLDCKVEGCQPFIQMLPKIADHLCEPCAAHFKAFRESLEDASIEYTVVPRLVRGLDYYVRTAFEIVSGELGAQNALVGGGRYDGLSEVLGGPPVQGFGFAMGLDRLVLLLPEELSQASSWRPEVFVAFIGAAAFRKATEAARVLRKQGHDCYLDFEGGSLKSQFRLAHKLSAEHVLIIGEDEIARGTCQVKRMSESVQWEATLVQFEEYLRTRRDTHTDS